ncbi:hypothetical protein PSFL_10570 [Pseudomonas sp. DD1]|jgi:hypothetical protein|nr:Uncharacterised protein [Pseudomonas fluorescens]
MRYLIAAFDKVTDLQAFVVEQHGWEVYNLPPLN